MPNMKSVISSHNKYVLSNFNSPTQQPDTCNCRKKPDCPLEGKCLQSNVIYQATVTTATTTETYVGLATNFKERRLLAVRCFSRNPSSSYLSQRDCKPRRYRLSRLRRSRAVTLQRKIRDCSQSIRNVTETISPPFDVRTEEMKRNSQNIFGLYKTLRNLSR